MEYGKEKGGGGLDGWRRNGGVGRSGQVPLQPSPDRHLKHCEGKLFMKPKEHMAANYGGASRSD